LFVNIFVWKWVSAAACTRYYLSGGKGRGGARQMKASRGGGGRPSSGRWHLTLSARWFLRFSCCPAASVWGLKTSNIPFVNDQRRRLGIYTLMRKLRRASLFILSLFSDFSFYPSFYLPFWTRRRK
jgi:hypothetical protein